MEKESTNTFWLCAKYPILECFGIKAETTIDDLEKFFNAHSKTIFGITKSDDGNFYIKFLPNKYTKISIGSLLFCYEGDCYYVLSKDVPTFLEFYNKMKESNGNLTEHRTLKNVNSDDHEKANSSQCQRQYQCPQCGYIANNPFTKCKVCGADDNSCAEQEITFTDITSKLKGKKMSIENVNLDKVIDEANSAEASAEVTAVYGDNVSVSKEEVDDQKEKDKEASNL